MSLHDQLLADLDDLEDEEDDLEETEEGEAGVEGEDEDDEVQEQDAMEVDLQQLKDDSVKSIAKLAEGAQLRRILERIDHYQSMPERTIVGPVEEDEEYKLIVEANNITAEIDNEIGVIHKFARDHYAPRFPELEQLVQGSLDYARTVKLLGNELDAGQPAIHETLPPATVMVVSVTASTTQGEELSEEALARVIEACDLMLQLQESKEKIYAYVESKMHLLAPNITHICGVSIAAKLLGIAGGLTALSKMPACNILLLGSQKKVATGFSAATNLPHTGHIFYSDVVQGQPPESRRKCARLVAGKLALAARVDAMRESKITGATVGLKLREEIEKKMEKFLEPPPVKNVKALPKPDEAPRKKRGGKRFRKMRDKYAMTRARKAANRMGFGELEEDEFQDEAQVNKVLKEKGSVRVTEQKQKGGAISKRMQKRLQQESGLMTTLRNSSVAGTASVSFTPLQGLEIVTTQAKKAKTDDGKYFSGGMQFVNVQK
ncbi:uncharacterized protein MONBRDRAFT_35569 [Monosiga brevicollis MX1]|uniref:Nop domain-containing protein n=1 Tax=Monosiga brevicollis TaxID=81824 RepID=A9UQ04_MONBE|nr:uncharacterized protein MONBRDRAFT_35569 [Monosiga brevicollis MX1]EDQ92511.1 predicted protein [Monosiga brevicollis MX1]|eukprot:XP_001742273.1 hypothetical protein [Monosiga brevicollis MX1]